MRPGLKIVFAVLAGAGLVALGLGLWVRAHPLAVGAALGRRALSQSGFVERHVRAAASEVGYWRGGSGPPLVLLHGAGDECSVFSRVAPAFVKEHVVVVPDLPGHGVSGPATGPLTMETLLAGVDAVIAREAPSGPVVVVGNGLGASLAVLWARAHPGRVARLVVVGGGPVTSGGPDFVPMPRTRAEARKLVEASRDPARPAVPDFVLDDVVRRANDGAVARIVEGGGVPERFRFDGRLGQLVEPVEVVWGASDRLVPLAYAKALVDKLPAARLTTIPACGHVPPEECPEALTAALKALLAQPPPAPRGAVADAAR